MTAWARFIDNVKWNYPFPLVIFGCVVFIVAAVLITRNIDNLLLRLRIRDHMPEMQKLEIKHYERIITMREDEIAWLKTELATYQEAARGAMTYLSGLTARYHEGE